MKATLKCSTCHIAPRAWPERFVTGGFGLAKTFWIFGVVLGFPFKLAIRHLASNNAVYIVSAVYVVYLAVLLAATWNAAKRYKGSRVWSVLALLISTISLIQIGTSALQFLPGSRE